MSRKENPDILRSTTKIVAAHLANNQVAVAKVPDFIESVYKLMVDLTGNGATIDLAPRRAESAQQPAVPIDASVTREYLVCLEDGKRLRMLKRYLMTQYQLTPEDYRAKWGLPPGYPMVAAAVSEERRARATKTGLGRQPAKRAARVRGTK